MSDMKLYNILETFDKLESATDKLTEYKGDEEVDESQTKVQNMGNKVKVTTDGDTTEFDDAETAAAFMGTDDDDNSFATESASEQYTECPFCHKDILSTKIKQHRKDVHNKPSASEEEMTEDKEEITEDDIKYQGAYDAGVKAAKAGKNINDINVSDQWAHEGGDFTKGFNSVDSKLTEGGLGGDDWDDAADALDFGSFDEPYNEIPPEMSDLEVPVFDPDASDLGIDAEMAFDELGEDCMEDDVEFATFDSENEAHRKRLQRGTPVVLDPELFTDPDVTRRGVFVSRSPSGDYARVVRDSDGKEVKVHLSDIKSADLVNNSVYEEYNLDFDAMLAEDITMTQTTNMENPENDTTTVTAVGAEAGEELAAMMANAGLNGSDGYDAVDTGEPEGEMPIEIATDVPAEMPMQDMIGMMDGPEVAQEAFGDEDDFDADMISGYAGDLEIEPSNADLDAIDSDPEWDLDFDMEEATDLSGNTVHTPMTRDQAMAADGPVTELERLLTKFDDSDIIEWLQDGNDSVDEALYAISMEDMPYGTQKARTGDPQEWLYDRFGEDIAMYARDNFGYGDTVSEEFANEPDERTAGADMVTHGTSGGLNRPKTMHKPAAGGDNAMQRPMKDMFEDEMEDDDEELEEALSPKMQARKERDQEAVRVNRDMSTSYAGSKLTGHGKGTDQHDKSVSFGLGKTKKFENVHENVDNFLDMYKEFKIRGEKK